MAYFYARYLQFRPNDYKLYNYQKSQIKLEKIMVKISYYDIRLLYNLANEFNQGFDKYNKFYEQYIKDKNKGEEIIGAANAKELESNIYTSG